MAEIPPEKPPTQGQPGNTVGKFYSLTPAQFASPKEYWRAKLEEREQWRNSLQTKEDFEREARDLLQHIHDGDSFQRNASKDALGMIISDSEAKGIKLSPEIQGELDAVRVLQGSKFLDEAKMRMGGRGLRAAQRRPGGNAPFGGKPPPPGHNRPPSGNNVQVRDPASCKRQKERIENQTHDILVKRTSGIENNPGNLPFYRPDRTKPHAQDVLGHMIKLRVEQFFLRMNIIKYMKECGGPLPPRAQEAATAPLPKPKNLPTPPATVKPKLP